MRIKGMSVNLASEKLQRSQKCRLTAWEKCIYRHARGIVSLYTALPAATKCGFCDQTETCWICECK